MDEGIRSPLCIQLRASSFYETHALIEANSLRILRVDVRGQCPMQRHSMLQQLATDTIATDIGIDEKRLHMYPIDQHEAVGIVIFIDGNSHSRMGQKTTHFGINGLSVFGTEKVMGRVHGAPPKVNQSGTIFRA